MADLIDEIDLHSSGWLLIVRRRRDAMDRRGNGLLQDPPRMFVALEDARLAYRVLECVSFELAEALCPDDYIRVVALMDAARNREWDLKVALDDAYANKAAASAEK